MIYEQTRAVLWRYALPNPVGGSGVHSVDLIVVELSAGGLTGLGFSYVLGRGGAGPVALARDLLAAYVLGQPVRPAPALWRTLAGGLNRLGRGAGYVGLAAIDVAAWDLQAKLAGVPLCVAMGGAPRQVPVYGSGWFNAGQSGAEATETAVRYAEAGFVAVKPRAAGRPSDRRLLTDLARAVPDLQLMVDANEKCDLLSAMALASVCHDVGATFLEEPLPSSQRDGFATLARQARIPIAGGEHLQGCSEVKPFLDNASLALLQPDLAMMGGLTECLRVAALAEHYGRPVSPHFLPDLFVHLAGAAPNVTWLEHFPLLEPLFEEAHGQDCLAPMMAPPARIGHGMAWSEAASNLVEVMG